METIIVNPTNASKLSTTSAGAVAFRPEGLHALPTPPKSFCSVGMPEYWYKRGLADGDGTMIEGHADDLSTALVVVAWVGFGISCIVIGLRVWVRLGKLGADRLAVHDMLMVAALVFTLIAVTLITLACKHGLGKHQNVLSYEQQYWAQYYNRIDEAFLVFAPMLGRISVAVLLLSILGPTRQFARYLIYVLIALQIIENVIIVVQAWAQCHSHPSALWDPHVDAKKYCDSLMFQEVMAYLSSGINSLTDLILTAIPAWVLLQLKMRARTKVALIAVFAFGLVAFAVSVVKAVQNGNLSADDFTFQIAWLQIYILVEANVILCTGTAPTLRPLWKKPTDTRYYGANSSSNGRSRNTQDHSRLETQRSHSDATKDFKMAEDGASEEYILESQPRMPAPIHVTRTTDVSVQWDGRRMTESDQREYQDARVVPSGW